MLKSVPWSDQIAGFSMFKGFPGGSQRSCNKRKQMTAESVLGPVHSSKVSKVAQKKRLHPYQEESFSHFALSPPGEQTGSLDSGLDVKVLPSTLNVALRRSERKSKLKGKTLPSDSASTFLRPTHSSKVSKAARKKTSCPTQSSTKQCADDTNSLPPLTNVVRF